MTDKPHAEEDRREFREEAESLWRITLGPLAWSLHFVVCYGVVSLGCNKLGGAGEGLRLGLVLFSIAVLAVIGWIGWRAFRQWDVRTTGQFSNPTSDPENRHQFLGHAAFLLAGVSAIGVIFVTLPILMIGGCS